MPSTYAYLIVMSLPVLPPLLQRTLREDMHVLVQGERIREISESALTAPQAQVIDCQGKTLMPGLIDAHVHLIATSLNLGQLAQEPVSLTMARARHIAEGMLQRGFTTVRDAGGRIGVWLRP